MSGKSVETLSYAIAEARPRRFRHLKAIFPFTGGLVVGGLLAGTLLGATPDFVDLSGFWFLAIPFGVAVLVIYTLVVLLIVGFVAKRTQFPLSAGRSFSLGIVLPVTLMGVPVAVYTCCVLASPPDFLKIGALAAAWVLTASLAALAPIKLRQLEQFHHPTQFSARAFIFASVKIVSIVAMIILMIVGGRRSAAMQFDRECEHLALWAKMSRRTPGAYLAIALPSSYRGLSEDGTADVVVIPDGRVLIVLKTSHDWGGTWSGIAYFSAPIKTDEVGRNEFGYLQLRISGLPRLRVEEQIGNQHFRVDYTGS